MKIRKLLLGASVILMATGSPSAWSHPDSDAYSHHWKQSWERAWSYFRPHSYHHRGDMSFRRGFRDDNHGSNGGSAKPFLAPEIDAGSGTSAMALMAGILLLAGERARSRRR